MDTSFIKYTNLSCDDNIFPEAIYKFILDVNYNYYRYEVEKIEFETKIFNQPIINYNDWVKCNKSKLTIIFQTSDNLNITIYNNNIQIPNQVGLLTVFPSIFYYSINSSNKDVVMGNAYGKNQFK